MYPLPPPPPTPSTPPTQQFKQIDAKREAADQNLLPPELPISSKRQFGGYSKLQNFHRTNPIIWCLAIFCMIFSILLIFFGIATLIVFVGLKPRSPLFDTPSASLTVVYIDSADSAQYLNSDFTFMANFSNPNRKLGIKFEYLKFELYSFDTLIAARVLEPFTQTRRETRLVTIQMISSLVYFPPNHAIELQKQVLNNRIMYHIIGNFRVRINLGLVHFSYWLHSRCQLELTSPPTGVLVAHSCSATRRKGF